MSERLRCGLFVMGTDGGSYPDILDQAVLAERCGFDSIVLAERHLRHADLLCPSPFEVGAAIAARTERVRVGVAGRILALDHPLHVAEAAATLDVLSDGRLDFGATRASLDDEAHRAFSSPADLAEGRFVEALEVIQAAWTRESFSYTGEHFRVPELSVEPKPLQSPCPPIYIVAVSDRRLAFAARRGLNVYVGAIRTPPELAATAASFEESLAAAGNGAGHPTFSVNRFVYVSDTDARAAAEFEDPLMRLMHERAPDLKGALIAKYGDVAELTFDRFLTDFAVVGGPETVTRRLEEVIAATGTDYLLLTVNFVTMRHELCVRSMELLAAEVLPRLAGRAQVPA
jgi:alkanesulfonate monooxygenase SsuD/methylene tetrahydromethanopterin reductase-like flavin-dependent oxidoreductase (luciferase family)